MSAGPTHPNMAAPVVTDATARVIERFTRLDADAIDYQVTVDDPARHTQPWTAAVPMTTRQGPLFEYACHEGNYSIPLSLGGARVQEREKAAFK